MDLYRVLSGVHIACGGLVAGQFTVHTDRQIE